MPPLLSCHLRCRRHGLARPLSGSAYHPARCGASSSGSSPGSSPYGPGCLIDPGASGHLRSPLDLDGVWDHLSLGSDKPMLKGYFGGTCCRTGSCRSSGRQGESGCQAGGHGDRVTADPAGPRPKNRSMYQRYGLPLPGRPVVPFVLYPLHQMPLRGVIRSSQGTLRVASVSCHWLHHDPRAGEDRDDGAGVG
jgi:hypothetical protein